MEKPTSCGCRGGHWPPTGGRIAALGNSIDRFPYFAAVPSLSGENKNAAGIGSVIISQGNQMARSTLLERRHLVHAYTWQGVPLTTALTRLTLGFQARLERLWEWETLIPKVTPLPQKSHFAIHCTSHPNDYSANFALSQALRYNSKHSSKMQELFLIFFTFFNYELIFH